MSDYYGTASRLIETKNSNDNQLAIISKEVSRNNFVLRV